MNGIYTPISQYFKILAQLLGPLDLFFIFGFGLLVTTAALEHVADQHNYYHT